MLLLITSIPNHLIHLIVESCSVDFSLKDVTLSLLFGFFDHRVLVKLGVEGFWLISSGCKSSSCVSCSNTWSLRYKAFFERFNLKIVLPWRSDIRQVVVAFLRSLSSLWEASGWSRFWISSAYNNILNCLLSSVILCWKQFILIWLERFACDLCLNTLSDINNHWISSIDASFLWR